VYLFAHEQAATEPSEFELILQEQGERHERDHLLTFAQVRNLADSSLTDRAQRTREAVQNQAPVIYQGVLRAALSGSGDIVTGVPDFVIRSESSYRIRDCKLARSMRGHNHPEIVLQLQTYGWLYEKTFGQPPKALEAYLGDRTIDAVSYAGASRVEEELRKLRALLLLTDEPWEPVGWSKCGRCPFQQRCWTRAAESHDVSVVYGIDQGTARALRDQGIATYDELLERMDAEQLAELTRPRGRGEQRVGLAAPRIITQVRALSTGTVIPLGKPELPSGPIVMLDLEGMPPQNEELDMVYLWGTQIYNDEGPSGPYRPAFAGFGPGADRRGWEDFLRIAAEISRRYGRVPFVHWADSEKVKIATYIERYGDTTGVARRVLADCIDLLKAVRDSFALPVPSYGLKVLERLSGFRRTMTEYGGDWSMARYIRASQSADDTERSRIMGEIARYNEEDLQAMAAVLSWARGLARPIADTF
jgi:predicted RecB family nuclease